MLHQPTVEKLAAMRLETMAQAWKEQEESPEARALNFEDRLALLVDRLWTVRQSLAFQQRLRRAKLSTQAAVEDIDYRAPRGLDRGIMRALIADSDRPFHTRTGTDTAARPPSVDAPSRGPVGDTGSAFP